MNLGVCVEDNYPRNSLYDYKVQQKVISLRPVYEIFDERTGEQLAIARQTWFSVLRSTMHIEDMYGNTVLTAKKDSSTSPSRYWTLRVI